MNDNVLIRALADYFGKQAKKTRKDLPVGEHSLDEVITLHVRGGVKVGKNTEYRPTGEIPTKLAFALFIHYSGITGPAAMKALVKALKQAAELAALPEKELETKLAAIREVADLAQAEAEVTKGLAQLPLKTRNGTVKTIVEIDQFATPELKGLAKTKNREVDDEAEAAHT